MKVKVSLPRIWGFWAILVLLLGQSEGLFAASNNTFTRTFHWNYGGCPLEFSYDIPWETYHFYQEKPRVFHNYAIYTYENRQFQFLPEFVRQLECFAAASGFDRRETLEMVIAMVQQLNYRNDRGEYPKFPIETIAEFGGDCEDTSILLAAMLREMGYGAVLINPPGHMAVAVECEGYLGVAYHQKGHRYYYVETTASGFGIGKIPESYRATTDKVIDIFVPNKELWLLRASMPKRKSAAQVPYFVTEDRGSRLISQPDNALVLATVKMHQVEMDGKISLHPELQLERQ